MCRRSIATPRASSIACATSAEVIANDLFFLDSRGEGGGGSQDSSGWSQPAGGGAGGGGDLPVDRSDMQPATADDDIPF